MSDIEWGEKRELTGRPLCPDWVVVLVHNKSGGIASCAARSIDWRDEDIETVCLPKAYEDMSSKLTSLLLKGQPPEEMRAALAAKFKDIPDKLVPHDPVEKVYNSLPFIVEGQSGAWDQLNKGTQEKFRAVYKAGMEAAK